MSEEAKPARTAQGKKAVKAGPRLAAVRGELAELQRAFGQHMRELEDAARGQKQDLAGAVSELLARAQGHGER